MREISIAIHLFKQLANLFISSAESFKTLFVGAFCEETSFTLVSNKALNVINIVIAATSTYDTSVI